MATMRISLDAVELLRVLAAEADLEQDYFQKKGSPPICRGLLDFRSRELAARKVKLLSVMAATVLAAPGIQRQGRHPLGSEACQLGSAHRLECFEVAALSGTRRG